MYEQKKLQKYSLHDIFSKLKSEVQAGLVECPRTHGYLVHSCLGWKIKDPAGATNWTHKGKHPGYLWASADLENIRKAGWKADADSWLWFPTDQSIRSP